MDIIKYLSEINEFKYWKALFEQGMRHEGNVEDKKNSFHRLIDIFNKYKANEWSTLTLEFMPEMIIKHLDNSSNLKSISVKDFFEAIEATPLDKEDKQNLFDTIAKRYKSIDSDKSNYQTFDLDYHYCYVKIDDTATMIQKKIINYKILNLYIEHIMKWVGTVGVEKLGITEVRHIQNYMPNELERRFQNPGHEYLIISKRIKPEKAFIFGEIINQMIEIINEVFSQQNSLPSHVMFEMYANIKSVSFETRPEIKEAMHKLEKMLMYYLLDDQIPYQESSEEVLKI
jgi:hypothetical protein